MFLHSKTGRWSATEQGLVNLTRQFNVKLILLDPDQNKVRSYTYPECKNNASSANVLMFCRFSVDLNARHWKASKCSIKQFSNWVRCIGRIILMVLFKFTSWFRCLISLAWVCKKISHLKAVKYSQRRALLRIEHWKKHINVALVLKDCSGFSSSNSICGFVLITFFGFMQKLTTLHAHNAEN